MKGPRKKIAVIDQNTNELLRMIGKKLARKRKALGFGNGDDFAYETGINRSQYGKYETGSKDLRIGTLTRIVNSMGMTLQEFLSEEFDS